MSATQKANLRHFKRQAGLLNRLLGSGAFTRLPVSVQHAMVGSARHLYQSLSGVLPEASLRKIMAGACALIIGLSTACSDDDTSGNPDAKVVKPDAGVDQKVADKGTDGPRPDGNKIDMLKVDGAKKDGAKKDAAKKDAAKKDAAKVDGAKKDGVKKDAAKKDAAKVDAAKVDQAVKPDLAQADQAVKPDQAIADQAIATPDKTVTPDAATPDKTVTPDAATNPGGNAFKTGVSNPWGFAASQATYYYGYHPTMADLDKDGDVDLVVGGYGYPGYNSSLYYYQNTGTKTAPKMAKPVSNVFTVAPSTYYETTAALVDIDGDGDLDMFIFAGYYQNLEFYKNIGTATKPSFASKSTSVFGLTVSSSAYGAVAPNFVDIDGDGDMDLFTVEEKTTSTPATLQFFENTGTKTVPKFAAPVSKKFGLPATMGEAIAFADMDGDGDLDMLGMTATGSKFFYWENTGTKTVAKFGTGVANPFGLKASGQAGLTTMVMGDMDGDGDLDILQGYDYGVLFYENTKK